MSIPSMSEPMAQSILMAVAAMGDMLTPGSFVFSIPEKLPSHEAAPMLCAGVTVYSPLKRHGAGPGRTVGVVGLGGLGHFAVLFAKALGADKVVVISRSNSKKDDAMKIGADDFVATGEDKGWDAPSGRLANSLDLIVSTVSSPDMPLSGYLNLLRFEGTFVQVGASMEPMPGVAAFSIIPKRAKITGSLIGSREEINEMLQLAADKGIKPWVEQRPMEDANAALEDMEHGLARYRYCLVNERYST